MDYKLELEKILDKCNLSEEERKALEDFTDDHLIIYWLNRPEYNKEIRKDAVRPCDAIKENPVFAKAKSKAEQCGQWYEILDLCEKVTEQAAIKQYKQN